jgi:hypothetical protein
MSTGGWVCGICREGIHTNHHADDGSCSLTGSPGAAGTPCACEWREESDAIAIPTAELPALVTEDGYYPVPDYVADMTRVLLASENHPDQLVRDIRKIAVQAITALHRMGVLDEAIDEPPAGSLEELLGDLLPRPVAKGYPDDPPAEPEPPRKRKTSAAVELMEAEGITAAEIREWAAGAGWRVSGRGSLSMEVVQAYIAAHEDGAA